MLSQADTQRGCAMSLVLAAGGLHALSLVSGQVVRLWDLRGCSSPVWELDVGPNFGPRNVRTRAHDGHASIQAGARKLGGSCCQRLALSPSGAFLALAGGSGGLAVLPVNLAEGCVGPVAAESQSGGSGGGDGGGGGGTTGAELNIVDWHPVTTAIAAGWSDGGVALSTVP